MSTASLNCDPRLALQGALELMRVFADSARVPFDTILARRVLSETVRAIPGDGREIWFRRLSEVAESVNLRVDTIKAPLDKVASFVEEGVPVALCREVDNGDAQWFVLTKTQGRKVLLRTLDPSETEVWLPWKDIPQRLGLESLDSVADWVIGRAALGCEAVGVKSADGEHGNEPTPFERLVSLLRPETRDLWVIAVFSAVVGILSLATPIAVEALVNTVAFGRYFQPVVILALLLFVSLAFAAALRALIVYVVEIIQRRLFIRVVEDLAYRLPRLAPLAMRSQYGPELVNRFFDVVTVQKVVSTLLVDGVSIVIQTVIGMLILAFYHPFLLGYDILLLILFAVTIFGMGRGAVQTAIKESKAKYKVAFWLEELTRLPTAFKLHSGPRFAMERADHLAIDWLNARRVHFRVVIRQIIFALGLQAVASTVLLGLGGWLVITGELTLGQLVAAELIVMMIVGSFTKLGKHLESIYDLLAAVDKLGTLFDLPVEPHDSMFHLAEGTPAELRVRNVVGQDDDEPLSFEVSPGEACAILGQPGSGKSQLLAMLAGLRQPADGHIEIDDIDYRELRPDALREQIGVCRAVEIFRGTIAENVHLNRPQLTAADVRDALKRVGLLDQLLRLPAGLNTELQPDGTPLTGTQALLLMIARAIVAKPRLLLIDGICNSLPAAVVRDVMRELTSDEVPWTLVVTTTTRDVSVHCDQVVHLEQASFSGPEI